MGTNGGYRLRGPLPEEFLRRVPAGTNLLVAGEAATRDVVLGALRTERGEDEGALLITERGLGEGLDACGERARECWCIAPEGEPQERGEIVGSPGAVPEIAAAFARLTERREERGVERVRVGVEPLDAVLESAEPGLAFRFLHLLTGQVRTTGLFCVAEFDPAAHDRATASNVRALFDAVLEVRRAEGGREARLRGFGDGPEEWVRLG
jgi:hypothetical protein